MRVIKIKNLQDSSDTYCDQTIASGEYYTIQSELERQKFASDSKVNQHLWSSPAKIAINDGSSDLSTEYGDRWLKSIEFSLNKDGLPIYDNTIRIGKSGSESFTFVTPDYTDRSTWYQKSERATGQSLTNAGDNLNFQAPEGKRYWININSPKLTLDYKKIPKRDGSLGQHSDWEVKVYVDSEEVTSGFTINYDLGKVTFDSAETGTVTADFSYTDGVTNPSEFLITPPSGYRFLIEHTEMQFSKNMNFGGNIRFEVWAGGTLENYGTFSQTLYDAGYGQSRSVYRSIRDLLNWFNNQYPIIPAPNNEFTNDILVFPFMFLQAAELNSSYGTLMRIVIENNTEFTGELATATIYMIKETV